MAYDRYDPRNPPRDERSRWSSDRHEDSHRGHGEDRGFFERASDTVASWFGDEDGEHRRHEDHRSGQGRGGWNPFSGSGDRDHNRDRERERERMGPPREHDRNPDRGHDRDRNWNDNRGTFARGGSSERDYNPSWRRELWGSGGAERDSHWSRQPERDRGGQDYRPMTGDYGRSERDRSQSEWGRDPYRQTSRAGTSDQSDRSRHEDPHYDNWRQRHMSELDRDYDAYRRENQSKFEDNFTGWRERRQQKRGLLGNIREHMEVVGNDDQHIGTVDKVAGDRIILTKSDPESGGAHHSISCSDIDRVEGERIILDCKAEDARHRWRDESRGRALFEREDSGEIGPRMLDRSFEGTYRR